MVCVYHGVRVACIMVCECVSWCASVYHGVRMSCIIMVCECDVVYHGV